MIARRVKNPGESQTHQDFPCDRVTAKLLPDSTTLYLVGGKFAGKTLTLTVGSPDLLVTIDKGVTVEVYHEPGYYKDSDIDSDVSKSTVSAVA